MLITPMFSIVAIIQGPFPVSDIQLMSRCAGPESDHSQAASPRWPIEIIHTIDIMLSLLVGTGQQAGISFSLFYGFESSLVWEFKHFQEFVLFQEFHEICKIRNFQVLRSLLGN